MAKFRAHQKRKAQRETNEWAEQLSDKDRTRMNIPRTRSQGELVFKQKVDPFMEFALENLIQHLNTKK
ncbi:MAG: hypothetical protein ACPGIF_03895 [Flavobacteriales bacterium]|jgi:hypothetical protein|tara:strand:+ start:398 stop:601 length:204 start_codon:yes stop_codon:yes gene_type:complete